MSSPWNIDDGPAVSMWRVPVGGLVQDHDRLTFVKGVMEYNPDFVGGARRRRVLNRLSHLGSAARNGNRIPESGKRSP